MGNVTDRYFICPAELLSAREVNAYDAVNLVAYAKVPLVSTRRGKDLVAGFVQRTQAHTFPMVAQSSKDRIFSRYEAQIGALRFPVAPTQYEPLLEALIDAGEDVLPYFYHEHHLLVGRRRRVAMFAPLHSELAENVRTGAVIVQRTRSDRVRWLTADAWMTQETLRGYLEESGVGPWWRDAANIASHARLERILVSDSLDMPSTESLQSYDDRQLPSRVFGEMLLARSERPRGYHAPPQQSEEAVIPTLPGPFTDLVELMSGFQAPSFPGRPSDADESSSGSPPAGPRSADAHRAQASPAQPFADEPQIEHASRSENLQRANKVVFDEDLSSGVDEGLLTKKQVANLLGVSVGTIDNYRRQPDFPKPLKLAPQTIRWKRADLLKWRELKKS